MSKKILITGGSGLVGSRLTELLLGQGHEVRHLSRRSGDKGDIKVFQWDIKKGTIQDGALDGVDAVIHLAGAGVADEKWTKERKKEILESRTKSTELLYDKIKELDNKPASFISASAIGYYGYDNGGQSQKEGSRFGDDFLATVTKRWEEEIDKIEELGLRVVKLRIGIVLATGGGAYVELSKPIKMGFGAPLGSGDQYMSWIHLEDLCNMFTTAMEDETYQGTYNAVAPNPVTNREMTKKIAKSLNKPCFLPAVPGFVLKLIVGEMASMLMGSNKVSSEKIQSAGFSFQFEQLEPALAQLAKQ
ncbi:MAG: TIGR01777 family oxidoreductase [Bacteroidota bacterium]